MLLREKDCGLQTYEPHLNGQNKKTMTFVLRIVLHMMYEAKLFM